MRFRGWIMTELERDFKNWLYQITRWKMYDAIDKQKAAKRISKEKMRPIDDIEPAMAVQSAENGLNRLEYDEKINALHILLNNLSWEEHSLIVLHHFEMRTYAEIADILSDKPLDQSERLKTATLLRKRISRLHEKLRKTIYSEPILRELFGT